MRAHDVRAPKTLVLVRVPFICAASWTGSHDGVGLIDGERRDVELSPPCLVDA